MGRSTGRSGGPPDGSFCLAFPGKASLAGLRGRLWCWVPCTVAGPCLALLHGDRAAVTARLHHVAAAHGVEDFFVSDAKHFKEGSFCGCEHPTLIFRVAVKKE